MTPFYDENGTEVNPDLNPKPDICLTCKKLNVPNEEIPCELNRMDQREDDEFKCFAFVNIKDC